LVIKPFGIHDRIIASIGQGFLGKPVHTRRLGFLPGHRLLDKNKSQKNIPLSIE